MKWRDNLCSTAAATEVHCSFKFLGDIEFSILQVLRDIEDRDISDGLNATGHYSSDPDFERKSALLDNWLVFNS